MIALRGLVAVVALSLALSVVAQGQSTVPAQQPAAVAVQPAPAQTPADAQPVQLPAAPARPLSATVRPPIDMSPWTMFQSADVLVKGVMVSLAFASVVTWTIFIAKTIQLFLVRRRLSNALGRIRESRTLAEAQLALGSKNSLLAALLAAAMRELKMSADSMVESGIKERAASRFSEIAKSEARAVRHGMGLLATIGSTAPFVGLFGTVWGIMNSFIGISKSQTTNLAVVAPGIAEALLATAIGLVAAIPAVIIYNHFSRGTKGYLDLVGRAAGTVGRLLSRDLDRSQSVVLSHAAE